MAPNSERKFQKELGEFGTQNAVRDTEHRWDDEVIHRQSRGLVLAQKLLRDVRRDVVDQNAEQRQARNRICGQNPNVAALVRPGNGR